MTASTAKLWLLHSSVSEETDGFALKWKLCPQRWSLLTCVMSGRKWARGFAQACMEMSGVSALP